MSLNPFPSGGNCYLSSNGKFINPHLDKLNRSLYHHIQWARGKYKDLDECKQPLVSFAYPIRSLTFDENAASVVWVNHSTFLLKVHGQNILTDPVFSHYTSPIKRIGPKRKHPPGVEMSDLPPIDYVLISHNHYDHLDEASVKALFKRFPKIHWIVPLGVKKWFLKRGITHVEELSWWQSLSFIHENGSEVRITSVPAQHYSGRRGLDFNKTLWMGLVFESLLEKEHKKVYFSGDTGYNPHDFTKIGECWQHFDLSLLPIGAYRPREFMRTVHVDPKEAVQIHMDVRSVFSIGMHWKTFQLSQELMESPPYDLFLAMEEKSLNPKDFIAPDPGIFHNW